MLQGKKAPEDFITKLDGLKEDTEVETLPLISSIQEGVNVLKIWRRAQNMSDVRNVTRKYVFGDQKQEGFLNRSRARIVGAVMHAVRFSKVLHAQRWEMCAHMYI